MKSHISYVDGLKSVSAIWVCLLHYVLAFFPVGYIGWECGVADVEKSSYFFNNLPMSFFTNSSFPLYTFFALISFIVSLAYFKKRDIAIVQRQAIKRYFRLMPPCLVCSLCCYVLIVGGFMFNEALSISVNSHWAGAFYQNGASLKDVLISSLYTIFIDGDGYYCSILWCMNVIFIGSYVVYAILALFGNLNCRWLVYAVSFLLCVKLRGDYSAFIVGVLAADIVQGNRLQLLKRYSLGLILFGLIIGNFIPSVSVANWLQISVVYAVGNFFVLVGLANCEIAKRLIGSKILSRVGKYSFSLILVHFPVMMSFSAWMYLKMRECGLEFWTSLVISWLSSLPVLVLASVLFYKFVECPSERVANLLLEKFGCSK